MWFVVALIGYVCLGLVYVLDKFILTKSVSKPVVYTFYSTIFMLGAIIFLPFTKDSLSGIDMLWALVSGLAFGFGLWAIYVAVKIGEASHINPFIGAVVAVSTYWLSSLFLGENLTVLQIWGIIILIAATFLLSFEKSHKHNGFHIGFVWAVLGGILFAISHVSAKYLYMNYDFFTAFIWTRFTIGFVGIILLLFSSSVRSVFKYKNKKTSKKTKNKKHVFALVASDKLLGVIGVILVQYAIAIGSVTLVNALAGVQFVIMFAVIYFLTKFYPKILKEYFTKRELVVEVVAILFIVVGSALFVF